MCEWRSKGARVGHGARGGRARGSAGSRTRGGGTRGETLLPLLADGDADAAEAEILGEDLLVETVKDKDEDSLHRGEDGEEDEEGVGDVGEGQKIHEITKDP